MKLLGAGLLLVALAHAQTYEIRGSVTEPGLGGIAGIVIGVVHFNEDGRLSLLAQKTTTDSRGDFRISVDRPGRYTLLSELTRGYYPLSFEGSDQDSIRVDEENPRAEVRVTVVRTGQVTGLVLDEETRQPVPNHTVALYDHGIERRDSLVLGVEEGITNRDGRFLLTDIRPADYVIATRPPAAQRYRFVDAPDPGRGAVAQGYTETFWPGNASSVAAARPVRLAPGGIVDVGTILLRKVPLYKIRISVPQGECPEGESVNVMVTQAASPGLIRPVHIIPCGSEETLQGFDPGSYTLYAVSEWQGERDGFENAVWALEPVTIVDKNQDSKLTLRRGVVLEGRITGREGLALPKQPYIASRPAEVSNTRPPWEQFIEWSSNTTFRIAVHPGPQELSVFSLSDPMYVKEVRYNGAPTRDDIIPVTSGAAAQSLEIMIDDNPAQLSGTVDFGIASPRPVWVLLERLTLESSPSHTVSEFTRPTGNGHFQFQGIRPGDYRIVAVPAEERLYMEPHVDRRLMAGAEKITIEAGVSRVVTLRLTNVSR